MLPIQRVHGPRARIGPGPRWFGSWNSGAVGDQAHHFLQHWHATKPYLFECASALNTVRADAFEKKSGVLILLRGACRPQIGQGQGSEYSAIGRVSLNDPHSSQMYS